MREYKQIHFLSTLKLNVANGCRLCALVFSKIYEGQEESNAAREVKLTYLIDDSLVEGAIDLFVSYQVSPSGRLIGTEADSQGNACFVIRLVRRNGEAASVLDLLLSC